MIVILRAGVRPDGPEIEELIAEARKYEGIEARVHAHSGAEQELVEVHLVGATQTIPSRGFSERPYVVRVVRVSERYRLLGRHDESLEAYGFSYKGVQFSQTSFHLFPGLCAVDNPEHVDLTFAAIARANIQTARMGAYKPRTSPYDFQGHGASCLPYVFELADKHAMRIVAMEITRESQIDEIRAAREKSGCDAGVMLQIGTRNAQNFELLKAVGQQREFPVLYKRGMGISLEEALNACEYIASEGNHHIVFCLRGVKTHLGLPHRNLVDFSHVPVIRRRTRLPVCIDPSHSAGQRAMGPDRLTDVHHVTAQGIVAGANMVLVDFHPDPAHALCDGPQALTLDELPAYVDDARAVRRCYEERVARARGESAPTQ